MIHIRNTHAQDVKRDTLYSMNHNLNQFGNVVKVKLVELLVPM